MIQRLSIKKRLLFTLPIWVVLLFLAVRVRKVMKRTSAPTVVELDCTTDMSPRGLYETDPDLGWKYKDGTYQVKTTCAGLEVPMEWTLHVQDGFRITGPTAEATVAESQQKEEIWLFGCSFLFGWGIEDDKTAAWLLQRRFPHWKIRNFARTGYGTTQFLVLFQKLLETQRPPRAAVFAHGAFHAPRNIDPQIMVDGNLSGFPAAVVEGGVFKEIRFVKKAITDDAAGVTLAVLKRIVEVCRERKVTPILSYVNGGPDDADARVWRSAGGVFVDLTEVDYTNPTYNLKPYDGHPNERGHRIYADRIAKALVEK